jgi:antitoxin component of MazEF toxin-antitoxin module
MLQTNLIPIGNSFGIRIPKSILASYGMERQAPIDMLMEQGQIILRPTKKPSIKPPPRAHWATAFAADPVTSVENLWGDISVDEHWDVS